MISNINYVKKTLGDLKAKKKFGQNFLIDSNIVDNIAKNACDINCKTIEIGPGLGALSDSSAVNELDNVDSVVLLAKCNESSYKTIKEEKNKLNDLKVTNVYAIVVE